MQEVSNEFVEGVYAQETDEVFLILLEIYSSEIQEGVIYLVNNWTKIVSNGITYEPCAFTCTLPNAHEESTPNASISIDNVDRRIGLAIRQMRTRPTFGIKIIRASNPDLVELEFAGFHLSSVTIDSQVVSGTIAPTNDVDQSVPKDTYNPGEFASLF